MNEIDIYDIANSQWYKQATSGPTPKIRVNPCAVAASAADGSSTQIYMFGGQNLVPSGSQTQYSDMWILTLPSFTWISVDTSTQSVPYGRSGHTCNIWDGQMVVVGGYVGNQISCDSPGVYVFDASELKWQNQFTALTGGNPENQQIAQSKNSTGLQGSYGYQVPAAVVSVIGGNRTGGATITAPVQTPTAGPLATGKAITYTVTQSNGATVTETGAAGTVVQGGHNNSGPNIAAIVAGVIAGCFALLAGYLGFCAYVYRKQLRLYKDHVAMAQRAEVAGPQEKIGFFNPRASENSSGPTGDQSSNSQNAVRSGYSGGNTSGSGHGAAGSGYQQVPMGDGATGASSSRRSSGDDLMAGQEPTFLGVMLNPRRSLRVINRD